MFPIRDFYVTILISSPWTTFCIKFSYFVNLHISGIGFSMKFHNEYPYCMFQRYFSTTLCFHSPYDWLVEVIRQLIITAWSCLVPANQAWSLCKHMDICYHTCSRRNRKYFLFFDTLYPHWNNLSSSNQVAKRLVLVDIVGKDHWCPLSQDLEKIVKIFGLFNLEYLIIDQYSIYESI